MNFSKLSKTKGFLHLKIEFYYFKSVKMVVLPYVERVKVHFAFSASKTLGLETLLTKVNKVITIYYVFVNQSESRFLILGDGRYILIG